MKSYYAQYLMNKTRQDYNRMAMLFSIKREKLTPDILHLKRYAALGDKILDLGCSSGRLCKLFDELGVDYTGSDVSEALISIAKKKHPEYKFILTGFFKLPFKKNTFDKIFCLSVIHHIPSAKLRSRFLREIRRVLKPKGKLISSVWFVLDNPKYKNLILRYKLKKMIGLSKLDEDDIFVPFKNEAGELIANRYIHCFSPHEFKKLISSKFQILKLKVLKRDRGGDNKNIIIVAE